MAIPFAWFTWVGTAMVFPSLVNCHCLMYIHVTCDYIFIGHEAVASEVGLGISTFKPSEFLSKVIAMFLLHVYMYMYIVYACAHWYHTIVCTCVCVLLFIPMQRMYGHWSWSLSLQGWTRHWMDSLELHQVHCHLPLYRYADWIEVHSNQLQLTD